MKIHHAEDPIAARMAAYPELADQIDAIYKFIDSLAQAGMAVPEPTRAWLDAIAHIKQRYPKKESS